MPSLSLQNVGDEKIADYFVVLQGPYLVMRKAVARSLASCDITNLAQYLKVGMIRCIMHVSHFDVKLRNCNRNRKLKRACTW